MQATFTNAEIKKISLNALATLGVHGMPRSTRVDVAMLRLLIAVPVGDSERAAEVIRTMRDEVRLVISQAIMPASKNAIFCADEQATVRHLQEAIGLELGVGMTNWKKVARSRQAGLHRRSRQRLVLPVWINRLVDLQIFEHLKRALVLIYGGYIVEPVLRSHYVASIKAARANNEQQRTAARR